MKINVLVSEDPTYDEDGVLEDEDSEFEDPSNFIPVIESFSPFDTVNS